VIVASGIAMQYGANLFSRTSAIDSPRNAYFLTANTPSPFRFAANPACCSRFATSLGTFRPLVSLFGVPV